MPIGVQRLRLLGLAASRAPDDVACGCGPFALTVPGRVAVPSCVERSAVSAPLERVAQSPNAFASQGR